MKIKKIDEEKMNEYAYYIHLLNNGYSDFEAKEIAKRKHYKKEKNNKKYQRFITIK